MPKSLRKSLNRNLARSATLFALITSAFFFLYLWRLGSLVPGYSQAEKTAIAASDNFSVIISNPVFAPHKLLQMGLTTLSDSPIGARLPSVIFGLMAVACMYVVLKRWFGKMIAALSTILFATLPWVVLSARSAAPAIMFLSAIYLIACYVWLSGTQRKGFALVGLSLTAVFLFYTPGMIWFLIFAGILWRKNIKSSFEHTSKLSVVLAGFIMFLGLVPLALAAFDNTNVLKSALLIPDNLPSIIEFLKSLIWAPLNLAWSSRDTYPIILDEMPLLSITAAALSVFGFYILWQRAKTELLVLLGLVIIAILGYGANRDLAVLTIALPAVGIMVGAGLRYLYAEWRSIFPLNPIPKSVALLLVISLISLNAVFGVRYSLLAWPNAPTTKSTYVLK